MSDDARPAGRILRNFGLIMGGEFAGQILAFAVGVYLARTLGADGFGVLVFVSTLVLYLVVIVDGGTETWGIREVSAGRAALPQTFRQILIVRTALGVIVALGLLTLAAFSEPQRKWALAAGVVSIFAFVVQSNWAYRAIESAAPAFGALMQRILFLVLALAFITVDGMAAEAVLLQGLSEVAASLLLVWAIAPRLAQPAPPGRPATSIGAMVRAAWPFCVARALRGLPVAAITSALAFIWHDAQTGYFGIALRIAIVILFAGSAFGLATFPALSRAAAAGEETEQQAVSAAVRLLSVILAPVALGGAILAAPLVDILLTSRFAEAVLPLQILMLAMLAGALGDNLRRVLQVRHRQRRDMVCVAIAVVCALGSAVFLVPAGGAIGASAALAIGEGSLLLLAWLSLGDSGGRPINLLRGLGAAAPICLAAGASATSGLFLPFPAALVILAFAYLLCLWLMRTTILSDLSVLEIAPGARSVS